MIQITECPRDAMQGIKTFIPTERKIEYIKALLKVGFPVLDAGSFVSPSAIPQMADTSEVFDAISNLLGNTKILAIVANKRGAETAVNHPIVSILGYPFSVSETFQRRNTNASIKESYGRVEEMLEIADKHQKELVVYLSMAFGNPYGDIWSPLLVADHAHKLVEMGVKSLSFADTTGISTPESVTSLYTTIAPEFQQVDLSLHLHALPQDVAAKTKAAVDAGCNRIDAALKGFGGCPMAADDLTGNMATEKIVEWCDQNGIDHGLSQAALKEAERIANLLFSNFH
jgi:hydroxymethylglutaryl-CoA lyase